MGARELIKRLSHDQREILVGHVPSPQPIDYRPNADGRHARRTMNALKRLALIHNDCPGGKKTPTHTKLTELGREVVAGVLAEYAEALISAGFTGLNSPLDPRPTPIVVKTPRPETVS